MVEGSKLPLDVDAPMETLDGKCQAWMSTRSASLVEKRMSTILRQRGPGSATLTPSELAVSEAGLSALLWASPPATATGPSGVVYKGYSLCMRPASEPRRSCIFLVESSRFDPLILLLIVLNCAMLAWESPLDPSGTVKQQLVERSEAFFLGAPLS